MPKSRATYCCSGAYKNIKLQCCGNKEIEKSDIKDLYEDEVVEFVAKSRPNDKNPDKDYWYATDVKQKEYE